MKRILFVIWTLTPVWGAEAPVVLYPGLGAWHHAIATRNADAQKFFDQGLSLLYGFNRYEALRSFRKAAELNPQAAMAYWGIAMALGPHVNMDGDGDVDLKAGCEALQTGLRLTAVAAGERAYLEAAATRCPAYDPAKYAAAMRVLAARYPDDLDAQTFYAESLMIPIRWKWYAADGTPAAGELEAEHALESVLRRWPSHAGANHFYIHAVESSKTPERAVPSAQRLMAIVPAAGHLVHMPGHIWLVLGDWETAASVNERAAEVDRKYFASSNVTIIVQEGDPVVHGEMAALRNAGRMANRHNTTMYTTLQPCFMCAGAIVQFGIPRVVIGDATNASSDETIRFLRSRGIDVIVIDPAVSSAARQCVELTARFREEKPEQWLEDWGGGPNPSLT